jgi:hypothetical protein
MRAASEKGRLCVQSVLARRTEFSGLVNPIFTFMVHRSQLVFEPQNNRYFLSCRTACRFYENIVAKIVGRDSSIGIAS